MKKIILLIFLTSIFSCEPQIEKAQGKHCLNSLITFSKLYGYVKYFHPSDEAANLDWDAFSIYGAKKVSQTKNDVELKKVLQDLFRPIAPTLQLKAIDEKFDEIRTTEFVNKKDIVFWQHLGNGYGSTIGYYKSARRNKSNTINPKNGNVFAILPISVDSLKGKQVKFTTQAKVEKQSAKTIGLFWPNFTSNSYGFQYTDAKIAFKNSEWEKYSVIANIPEDVTDVSLDLGMLSTGEVRYDSINIYIKKGSNWLPVYHQGFEKFENEEEPDGMYVYTGRYSKYNGEVLYSTQVSDEESIEGSKSYSIKSKSVTSNISDSLFNIGVELKEIYYDTIGQNLKISMPLALHSDSFNTYPVAESKEYEVLQDSLEKLTINISNTHYTRQGNLINTWNVIQHFYPYHNYLEIDWENSLQKALIETENDSSYDDFTQTLQSMLTDLADGHLTISQLKENERRFYPAFEVAYLEGSIVVSGLFEDSLDIEKGDIITKINGELAINTYNVLKNKFKGLTKGLTQGKATNELLIGELSDTLRLEVEHDGITENIAIPRVYEYSQYFAKVRSSDSKRVIEDISSNILYIDMTNISYDFFLENIERINASENVIFDLRGSPKVSATNMIGHFLEVSDTSKAWLKIPKIVYPNRKFMSFDESGWSLEPKSPRVISKKFFLIDNRAMSYTESLIGFIDHYELGTLVGSTTAGINGDITWLTLPEGYRIKWTGTEVVKHDGSQHFGVGFEPDVHVERTIEGIREGRDEVLEKAIELTIGSSHEKNSN